eukprot:c1714_g1_i1 orf=137-538(+)
MDFFTMQERLRQTREQQEEEERRLKAGEVQIDLPPDKLLNKGDPGTFQATIRGVMPVGYWVTMPSGKEAYLPAQDLGFPGGLEKLRQIFQVGQEITVRVVTRGGSGREILSLKKPDPNKPDPPPRPLRDGYIN